MALSILQKWKLRAETFRILLSWGIKYFKTVRSSEDIDFFFNQSNICIRLERTTNFFSYLPALQKSVLCTKIISFAKFQTAKLIFPVAGPMNKIVVQMAWNRRKRI